jgi:hypothetical protein
MGDINRQMGINKPNERSAKAHLIYKISIESFTYSEIYELQSVPRCIINLIDLGGSEPLGLDEEFLPRSSIKQKEQSL